MRTSLPIKYLIVLLSCCLKLQIKILNTVVDNLFLYYIYISFIIYSYFGCVDPTECGFSHFCTLIVVGDLMGGSVEIYFLCRIPRTKKWVIQLVGRKYFIENFPTGAELVLKYYLPLIFLLILELLTTYLLQFYYSSLGEYIFVIYQQIYGSDARLWSEHIKEFYLLEQLEMLLTAYPQGIVSYIAEKMNFIVVTISNFF